VSSRTFLALACAAGLGLTACTLMPRYERPPPPVASQFPGAGSASNAMAAADIGWREFFAEERLKRLIELALANNRDLRVATLNVAQSQAQYRITRSASFPTVAASASYTREHASGLSFSSGLAGVSGGGSGVTTEQTSAQIGISAYELDLFGRIRSLNAQSLQQYFATEEARRSAQIALVAEVATQYIALRQAQEQLQLAEETRVAVEESYRLNKVEFDAGQINELDLRTAEGQVETADINVITYQRQLAQAENALVLLVGQPLPDDLPAPLPFETPNLLADVPAGLPSDLVQRRPDILQAEHSLEAANANIGAARAAFFPSISLTGSVGSASTQLSGLFASGTGVWSFTPQISLPLFTGGKNRANLDSTRIGKEISVANYEKAIQTAFREVADALVASSTYTNQVQVESQAIQTQQRRLELASARYRQGEDSYLNVLSAQQDLYTAQSGRLQSELNRLTSGVSLYQALGGGWK
jgi:multidrug efflux system outer membrane protein